MVNFHYHLVINSISRELWGKNLNMHRHNYKERIPVSTEWMDIKKLSERQGSYLLLMRGLLWEINYKRLFMKS